MKNVMFILIHGVKLDDIGSDVDGGSNGGTPVASSTARGGRSRLFFVAVLSIHWTVMVQGILFKYVPTAI